MKLIQANKKHRGLKIFGCTFLGIVLLLGITLTTLVSYSHFYYIPEQDAKIKNDTGLIQAHNRALYDKNGNKIYLAGSNVGNMLLQEGWMSPFSAGPKKDENGNQIKEKNGTYQYPEFTEEEFLNALKENPNCGEENIDTWTSYYYSKWFNEFDFKKMKELGLNTIRLPFYWRNILNDYSEGLTRKSEQVAFKLFNEYLELAKKYDMYIILDLHGAPGSQNGYEHGGVLQEKGELYYNEDYIKATVDIWDYISDYYTNTRKDLAPYIASYDIMNEPCMVKDKNTTKPVWEIFDKCYDAIRENNDKHVVTFCGVWDFSGLPNPKDYGRENVQYQYHWYNWQGDKIPYNLFYAYHDMFNMFRNYNVPVLMGEFTLFEYKDEWTKAFEMYKKRNYNWTTWSYKVISLGDWQNSWGIYTACLNPDGLGKGEIVHKLDVTNCTFEEFKKYSDLCESSSANCKTGTQYNAIVNWRDNIMK